MSDDMIERVAMIFDSDAFNPLPGHEQGKCIDCDFNRDEARRKARAAIAAMRELPGEPGPRYSAGEYSRRNQEAMIDDALGLSITEKLPDA